jgi:benzil reductase ((S)-benzoin forming)
LILPSKNREIPALADVEFTQCETLFFRQLFSVQQTQTRVNYYFITGTSRGIGKAMTDEILLRTDVSVTGIGRSNPHNDPKFVFVPMDLANLQAVHEFEFPSCSNATKIYLVNNAGALGEVKHTGAAAAVDYEAVINLNLTAVMVLTNKFLAAFAKKNIPLVVLNISSGAGKNPIDGWAAYCTSKAGLDMFSRVVAEEIAISGKKHVRIFSVAPGIVDTAMQEQIRTSSGQNFSRVEQFKEYKSTGQLADPRLTAQKLISILDLPENFAETVFSAKDLTVVIQHTNQ